MPYNNKSKLKNCNKITNKVYTYEHSGWGRGVKNKFNTRH